METCIFFLTEAGLSGTESMSQKYIPSRILTPTKLMVLSGVSKKYYHSINSTTIQKICSVLCFVRKVEHILFEHHSFSLAYLYFSIASICHGGEWSSSGMRQILSADHVPLDMGFLPYLNTPIRTAATSRGGWSPSRESRYLGLT